MKKSVILLMIPVAFFCIHCGQNKTSGLKAPDNAPAVDTVRSENESLPEKTVPAVNAGTTYGENGSLSRKPVPAVDAGTAYAENEERLRRELREQISGALDQLSQDFLDGKIDESEYYAKKYEGPRTVHAYIDIWDYIPFFERFQSWEGFKLALLDEQPVLQFNADDDFPKLDGATALYPVYAAFAHAVYPKDVMTTEEDQNIYGEQPISFPVPPGRTYEFGEYETKEKTTVVRCSRTEDAYALLFGDDVSKYQRYEWRPEIIFCYEPSSEQRVAAAEKGVDFTMTPLGCDAFVFIVHEDNPADNLTQEQVRAIYSGEITNWESITGVDEEIIAYQRPKNSGSQTILEQIMGDTPLMTPITGFQPSGMVDMIEAVSAYTNYKNSIGYSFRFFTTDMVRGGQIKILSIDGVYPSKENIQNKTYPFAQPFYAITAGNEKPNVQTFIDWMLSPQGQRLVEKTGYTPVN
ncbi:MAG: substrate-binding domain-containing protein [Treponema sp.]|nr:substrate-binding domain-containing protein [Treponema sp.]